MWALRDCVELRGGSGYLLRALPPSFLPFGPSSPASSTMLFSALT